MNEKQQILTHEGVSTVARPRSGSADFRGLYWDIMLLPGWSFIERDQQKHRAVYTKVQFSKNPPQLCWCYECEHRLVELVVASKGNVPKHWNTYVKDWKIKMEGKVGMYNPWYRKGFPRYIRALWNGRYVLQVTFKRISNLLTVKFPEYYIGTHDGKEIGIWPGDGHTYKDQLQYCYCSSCREKAIREITEKGYVPNYLKDYNWSGE